MSGPALSKRQQARNEKVLQDLVQSVPGNNFCADCQARNPCMFAIDHDPEIPPALLLTRWILCSLGIMERTCADWFLFATDGASQS
jgi:hypothetical protein